MSCSLGLLSALELTWCGLNPHLLKGMKSLFPRSVARNTSCAELACSVDILKVKPTSQIQVVTFSLPKVYELRREHCESELSRSGHERNLGAELLEERISTPVLYNYVFPKN